MLENHRHHHECDEEQHKHNVDEDDHHNDDVDFYG